MDKLEAIKWLKSIKDKYIHGGDESYDSRRTEAIDYAIAALSETVKTNADHIRAMSDEELAKFLADEIPHGDCCDCDLECATFEGDKFKNSCHNAFYRWLKQPAEEGIK